MKKRDLFSVSIFIVFCLFLFFISNCLKISFLTQPKLFGLFIVGALFFLVITKKIKYKDIGNSSLIRSFAIGFISLAVVVLFSIIINRKIALTYVFEVIRPMIYLFSAIIFVYLFKNREKNLLFNKILYCISILFFVINFIQFFNFFNVNNLYIRAIAPTQYATLVDGYAYPRVVGLMSNPNVYGYVLSLFNLYFVYLLVKNYKNNVNKKNVFLLCLLFMNRVSIYMTGSRTAFIICVISELLFIFYCLFEFNRKKGLFKCFLKPSFVCLGVLLAEFALMFALPNSFSWRIKTLFSGNIVSWEIRKQTSKDIIDDLLVEDNDAKDNKEDNIEGNSGGNDNKDNHAKDNIVVVDNGEKNNNEFKDNNKINNSLIKEDDDVENWKGNNNIRLSIFGVGPIKDGFSIDNEWIHIFVIYGVLGVLAFLATFVIKLFYLKNENKYFIGFYISILLLNFIYMVSAGSFFSYNMFIAFVMFIVLVNCGEAYEK